MTRILDFLYWLGSPFLLTRKRCERES